MIVAVIVIYHPDLDLLDRLVRSVLGQVEMIFAVDNTPGSSDKIAAFLNQYDEPITYKPLRDNMGIAYAQNVGIREAINQGCTHVLLLDQDSALSPGMVKHMLEAEAELLRNGKRVAAVGPLIVDRTVNKPAQAIRYGYLQIHKILINRSSHLVVESDCLLASGSLIRIAVINDVGYMLEELFIDWVDTEWCLRARFNGYRSYIIPFARMDHSLGDTSASAFGRSINLHNDSRHYYIVRNATYLLKLKTMGLPWRIIAMLRIIPGSVIKYSWFSKRKTKAFISMLSAIRCGISCKLGRVD